MRIQKPREFQRVDFENRWIMWILLICLLTFISCIPVVIPIPTPEKGAPLNEDAVSEILESPRSKAEVKEIFSQIPLMREETDLLVYRWPTTEWTLAIGVIGPFGGAGVGDVPLPADNILTITFDTMGMVDRYKIVETGASKFSDEEISQAIAELQSTSTAELETNSTGTDANGEW